ncbi:hypothetical protein EYF80_046471 [Liparis tanakae]|uniref:Uncharacterized protein n=1 Tax=Liparis tanakae TaxID=230148 RepID=A0A4Z2FQZ3_9TELE|nr:hypothetical protein EYF80_046471 [Liparis tanakae]
MLREYTMRSRRSAGHPDASRALSLKVLETRSSLMYVSMYSSLWQHRMILWEKYLSTVTWLTKCSGTSQVGNTERWPNSA